MVSPCYLLLLQAKRGDRKTGSGRDQSKEGKSEIHHASNDERHADHDPDQQNGKNDGDGLPRRGVARFLLHLVLSPAACFPIDLPVLLGRLGHG